LASAVQAVPFVLNVQSVAQQEPAVPLTPVPSSQSSALAFVSTTPSPQVEL
jgi:hypothetical protein